MKRLAGLIFTAAAVLAAGCGKSEPAKAPLSFVDASAQLEDAEKELVKLDKTSAWLIEKYGAGEETDDMKANWATLADLKADYAKKRAELVGDVEHARELKEQAKH